MTKTIDEGRAVMHPSDAARTAKDITLWIMHDYGVTNGDAIYRRIYTALSDREEIRKVLEAAEALCVDDEACRDRRRPEYQEHVAELRAALAALASPSVSSGSES